jgi:ubiquitin carboxyl-terminal hydrolase 10
MFLREFKAIETAPTSEQLRKRVKPEELEKYGDPFTPEFVYEAIRTLPRFASMRVSNLALLLPRSCNIANNPQRGHQQDAQEFLGFLLEGLHDECARVISTAPASTASTAPNSSLPSPSTAKASDADGADDWLEVGRRQRPAVTRSSGHSHTQTPITKIFGGQLRSELRVPGNKNSVTLEPYQPLQLDIGAPEVRNIIDALRGLTRPEVIHGDFNSPHGKDVKATKQVFIESVPPVLILHLKRFQFDAEGYGTVKVWKKVGYPLEFEFPREVLSRQTRNTLLSENSNPPRYRLIGVVYHHGKNASGGHYTVDVRRQDSREWIRIDDTIIRRVRDEDVAEGGSEEDSGKTDARKDASASSNRFSGMNDEDTGDDEGWKQAAGGKKWSSVVNGTPATNGHKAKPLPKDSIKDNKVAYLLFYQRI